MGRLKNLISLSSPFQMGNCCLKATVFADSIRQRDTLMGQFICYFWFTLSLNTRLCIIIKGANQGYQSGQKITSDTKRLFDQGFQGLLNLRVHDLETLRIQKYEISRLLDFETKKVTSGTGWLGALDFNQRDLLDIKDLILRFNMLSKTQ